MSKFDITLQRGRKVWSVTLEAGSAREARTRALKANRDRIEEVEVLNVVKLHDPKPSKATMPAHVAAALERSRA